MRTVDATLLAAIQGGEPLSYIKVYVGYTNGTVKNSHTKVYKYKLTGTTLDVWIPISTNFGSDQEMIWLERGLTIAGTTYTVTTGRFYILEEEYLPGDIDHIHAAIVPAEYYSAAGDVTYETAIDAFFTAFGKTTTYKDDTEAWLDYQFLPDGKLVLMNHAMRFLNLLHQKRLISVCDNGAEDVRIYSADVLSLPADVSLTALDEFRVFVSKQLSRQYIWRDENETVHLDGSTSDPLHNLGYLESTASPPARNTGTAVVAAYVRPDLRIQDGDLVTLYVADGRSATFFAKVTEEWDPHSTHLPKWRLFIESNPVFSNTEGGALPSTIERVSNYTPLNTSTFNGVLSERDNNLQAAMETLDDHTRYKLSANRSIYVRDELGSCTISNASPAVVTLNAHGLSNGDRVVFRTTGGLPTGLTVGTAYYVVQAATNTFQVSATLGGASINTSSAGSGTHYAATGSDTNDGTAADRAHALLTIQAGVDQVGAMDISIYSVTIQLANSHYVESPNLKSPSGSGGVTILGDATTPGNVTIDGGFSYSVKGVSYTLQGFKLTKSTTSTVVAMSVSNGATLAFLNLEFSTGFTFHIYLPYTGTVFINGSYTISGGAARHIDCELGSVVRQQSTGTGTVTGTPAFSSSFILASDAGFVKIISSSFTYSGAATGTRYTANMNSIIDTVGGGANFFPGNAAGSTATGGQYA